jgi:hypothetical protein
MPHKRRSMHVRIAGHLFGGVAPGAIVALVLLLRSYPPILRLTVEGSSAVLGLALYLEYS